VETPILAYRNGELKRSGRGLAFWFRPMGAAVAEVPIDDRDQQFMFHARSADYQDIAIQGVVTYRVEDAEKLATRLNFAINLTDGLHLKQPLDQLATLLTGLAQRGGQRHVATLKVQELVAGGFAGVQSEIETSLFENLDLREMGVVVVAAQVFDLKLAPELTKALSTPTREEIQKHSDEATFERRAVAVEKERAIEENELQNKIELARREEKLIQQCGENEARRVTQQTESSRIASEADAARAKLQARAEADRVRIDSEATAARREIEAKTDAKGTRLAAEALAESNRLTAQATAEETRLQAHANAEETRLRAHANAERIRLEGEANAEQILQVEGARATTERARLDAYRDLPTPVVVTLAAQEMAGKISVEHLNVTPELLGPVINRVLEAGARRLEGTSEGER
jgi:hypothetical protein